MAKIRCSICKVTRICKAVRWRPRSSFPAARRPRSCTSQWQERQGRADPRGIRTRRPASGREMQNHLRDGDAGSEDEVGRYRQGSARRRHDSHADGARNDFAACPRRRSVDDVNPDEAVAVGAAIQAILVVVARRRNFGRKDAADDTRQQFSSREGGLIQVTNITSHTLGVVLWDEDATRGIRFPDDPKNDGDPSAWRRIRSAPPMPTCSAPS